MSKKEVTVVETKAAKVDMKTLAQSIEVAFKKHELVDVIADTNLENPTALSYDDYRFIHFYRKGTTKDMFQLYLTSKSGKFIIRNRVAELLGKDVDKKPITKKDNKKNTQRVIHVEVTTPIDTVNAVAEKIIAACVESTKMVIENKKTTKKAEKKSGEEKTQPSKVTSEKKAKTQATEKKAKKVVNK